MTGLHASRYGLAGAKRHIDKHFTDDVRIEELAKLTHHSLHHFIRQFQRRYHETPHQYIIRKRLELARELLSTSNQSVTEICFAVGYESTASFSILFRNSVGWSPSAYRARVRAIRANPHHFIPGCISHVYKLKNTGS